jgi:hypothetical protein
LKSHRLGATAQHTGLGIARCLVAGLAALYIVFTSAVVRAQGAPPGGHEDAAFDFMNLLSHGGLHDIENETWNAYGQFTAISNWKLPFSAAYTDLRNSPNSLSPNAEESFTGTFTLFFGLKLWRGGEAYVVPEIISEKPLSDLRGIGGAIQNFELQKQGSETPTLYRSRAFLRQTIDLGGERVREESNPLQLGGSTRNRRIVLTAGNFTILDVFDHNSISPDPRQTFLNMAFMTYASWDFPSDARGYSWGATGELYWDDWAFRIGRITPPQNPNALAIDFRLWKYYGDQIEIEHDHKLLGQAGAVRLLGYRNHVFTGSFDDAIAAFEANPANNAANCQTEGYYNYNSTNTTAPDLCFVRKPNDKLGIGVSLEQHFTDDIGLFFRGMYSDGRTEVDAFNSADRSIAIGAAAKGSAWRRPFDVTGVGFAMSWISDSHAKYLAMGGVDGFVGDGALRQAGEGVVDAFYSFNLIKAIWLSPDYQFIWNPGFNADRGPVHIFGGRVHAEF